MNTKFLWLIFGPGLLIVSILNLNIDISKHSGWWVAFDAIVALLALLFTVSGFLGSTKS